jgi:hypothetical protein
MAKTLLRSFSFWFAVVASLLLLIVTIFRDTITDSITIFLFPFLWSGCFALLFAACVIGIIFCVRKAKKLKGFSAIPGAVSLLTAVASLYIVFANVQIHNSFEAMREKREAFIAEFIEKGYTVSDISYVFELPNEYKSLSKGGSILIGDWYDDQIVFYFYTNLGLIDSSNGYAYFVDNTTRNDYFFFELIRLKDMGGGWWYCATV